LVVQLRAKFSGSPSPAPGWLITSAINPSSYGAGFIDLTTCAASMDFFNAMTYDYHGNWGDHVGHNAQILGASGDPDGSSVNTKVGIDYMMVTRGIAASQLNLFGILWLPYRRGGKYPRYLPFERLQLGYGGRELYRCRSARWGRLDQDLGRHGQLSLLAKGCRSRIHQLRRRPIHSDQG
jgi:hypothetical protein